jgi:shikimate dehydrogenase
MMRAWLEAAGLSGTYGRIELPEAEANPFFCSLPDLGWAGVNVTAPHKQTALNSADTVSPAAQAVGAANLLTVGPDGKIQAENTDLIGIAAALAGDDTRSPAVLIGAGGAARAALVHLIAQDRSITVVNRTLSKAEALATQDPDRIRATTDLEAALPGAGLVINATTLGMHGRPALCPDLSQTAPGARVFDMVYAPLETGLLKAARHAGRHTVDGLSMLIGQARPSFEAFYGSPPPSEFDMRAHLLAELGAAT